MADEILKTRLTEVRKTLDRAGLARLRQDEQEAAVNRDASGDWNVALSLPDLEKRIIKPMWMPLETQFKRECASLARKINNIERKLDELKDEQDPQTRQDKLGGLWKKYLALEAGAEELLGEIVELLGGLAFRDRSVDPWFFVAADALVNWYANQSGDPWDPLTVPCIRRAVARTLARVVGLRFPDWTFWALPLIGYEFALQFLRLTPDKATRILEIIGESVDLEQFRKQNRLILLAHVFATFTTGPAYAFAALNLRLSPGDSEAADVILNTLQKMDENVFEGDFLTSLTELWHDSPASGPRLEPGRAKQLQKFSDAAYEALKTSFLDQVRYSVYEWASASQASDAWKVHGKTGKPLPDPGMPRLRLVDMLNAGWYSRFKNIANAERIEPCARRTCMNIILIQSQAGSGSGYSQTRAADRPRGAG